MFFFNLFFSFSPLIVLNVLSYRISVLVSYLTTAISLQSCWLMYIVTSKRLHFLVHHTRKTTALLSADKTAVHKSLIVLCACKQRWWPSVLFCISLTLFSFFNFSTLPHQSLCTHRVPRTLRRCSTSLHVIFYASCPSCCSHMGSNVRISMKISNCVMKKTQLKFQHDRQLFYYLFIYFFRYHCFRSKPLDIDQNRRYVQDNIKIISNNNHHQICPL